MSDSLWRVLRPGVRVVVRRVRADEPGPDEPRVTDVLGELTAVDEDGMTILTRRGTVRVPATDVVLCKVVPAAPPPRAGRSV